ncbi:hypothetical protein GCM10009689_17080 [Brevibacterium antiquum]|uniref:hypothetical protein n=1 Tax=Brevibacterium antiquum TaxID=234835 RepID=UPI0018E06499|nr:hypothetical protein [Brevibacterium antiquum]
MSEATADIQPLVIAAINATGPRKVDEVEDGDEVTLVEETEENWVGRVSENARLIYSLINDDQSPVVKAVGRLSEAVKYVANVVEVKKEKSSNRALVTLETKPSKKNPEGKETVRTDRFDDGGRPMASKARSLIGRRVLVFKYMESATDGSGRDFRILVDIKDLGEAREFDE